MILYIQRNFHYSAFQEAYRRCRLVFAGETVARQPCVAGVFALLGAEDRDAFATVDGKIERNAVPGAEEFVPAQPDDIAPRGVSRMIVAHDGGDAIVEG